MRSSPRRGGSAGAGENRPGHELDTNVLVSGLLSPQGPPGEIVSILLAKRFVVLADERVIAEYDDVLNRSELRLSPQRAAALLEFLAGEAHFVDVGTVRVGLSDPDDRAFLEVAIAGRAEALVTGNLRHFPVETRQGVRVLTPAEFVEVFGR